MKRWIRASVGIVGFLCMLLGAGGLTVWLVFGPENWPKRKARFAQAAERGKVIIEAIESYTGQEGTPPPSLEALVPKYLKAIPNTGLSDYPSFEYLRFEQSKLGFVWYDLGSRQGKPMTGLWVFVDGDSEHAILGLTLDQNEDVTEARTDRMPETVEERNFDAERWKSNESRIEMVRSLPRHILLKGQRFATIKEMLGEPTGMRILRNSPWELRINCSGGMLNWDVFFYWPTLDYPQHIYGGSIERIKEWAYVHE